MDGEIGELSNVHPANENDSSDMKLILVNEKPYETFRTAENAPRIKYYKQTYRRAWEQMPDFAGWLTGVENEPTRAFCIYCQKTLHAHRLSLLKHTCTIRHQKAAQMHQLRKVKSTKVSRTKIIDMGEGDVNEVCDEEDDEEMVEYSTLVVEEGESTANIEEEEEDAEETEEIHLVQDTKEVSGKYPFFPPISTQVTDTVRGCPVSGLAISLYKLIDGKWTYINEGYTNHSGRFSKFVDSTSFTTGRYKLHYDVDKYFESKKQSSLYPFIEIVFDCKNLTSSYHIPLILSPNGYSTFRGSL